MSEKTIPKLSVIIPTLNAVKGVASTLACFIGKDTLLEIIIVDGGSSDKTVHIAENLGAKIITSPKGRGTQLAKGATEAQGEFLLFIHGDTTLSPDWEAEVTSFMANPDNQAKAAAFTYALDDEAPAARRVERMVALRCEALALPYGDQGLLISRDFYQQLGGYKPLPLMEDVDIIRRIGRKRISYLKAKAITSATRYHKGGYWRRPLFHLFCLALYFLGVAPEKIAKLYN
ncbi:MAG: TIGR04283 family arsenosugar biosynthesis glycosyltransferase [Rhodospirillales bacterium]|nr:TIGR04283 family arsenosugar biosynthesis glycosyltransferase [Rhodospirillales bacterium]